MKIKTVFSYVVLGGVALTGATSCTWRQVGCAAGAAAASAATYALLGDHVSDGEKAAYTAIAGVLGCMIGSELAGVTEEYVSLKREEYRNEAEYLKAQNALTQEVIDESASEIAWLEDQAATLEEQLKEGKSLSNSSLLKSQFKEAASKRQNDVALVESNLNKARKDTYVALKKASDAQEKAALQTQIKELDAQIVKTKAVKRRFLAAGNEIRYM